MTFWSLALIIGLISLIVLGIAAFVYFLFIRPWILRMGVTKEEFEMLMPGDGLVASPTISYTKAVTIKAPKEVVWAYLIQVGYRRAGWYNWDFINRRAAKDYFYEGNKSANRIIPELQNLKEGDKIHLTPQLGLEVARMKKYESLLLTSHDNGRYIVSWSYILKEVDRETVRLYVRWSSDTGKGFLLKLVNIFIVEAGGAGIQQSGMLKGIKLRAEKVYSNAKVISLNTVKS